MDKTKDIVTIALEYEYAMQPPKLSYKSPYPPKYNQFLPYNRERLELVGNFNSLAAAATNFVGQAIKSPFETAMHRECMARVEAIRPGHVYTQFGPIVTQNPAAPFTPPRQSAGPPSTNANQNAQAQSTPSPASASTISTYQDFFDNYSSPLEAPYSKRQEMKAKAGQDMNEIGVDMFHIDPALRDDEKAVLTRRNEQRKLLWNSQKKQGGDAGGDTSGFADIQRGSM